jgi:RNA polymerase sigma-70 factor (ECF subfamily)
MAFCRHATWTADDIEDVLQSALSTAYATFHAFQPGSNFRAWMFAHLQHAAFQHNRRKRPQALADDVAAPQAVDPRPAGAWEHGDARQAVLDAPATVIASFDARVRTAVLALSDVERTALLLRSVGSCTYQDIADILAMPIGTVMSHLARARAKMRTRLASGAAGDA